MMGWGDRTRPGCRHRRPRRWHERVDGSARQSVRRGRRTRRAGRAWSPGTDGAPQSLRPVGGWRFEPQGLRRSAPRRANLDRKP